MEQSAPPDENGRRIQPNHRFNSLPWSEEDVERRTTVADAEIAANKSAIDRFNQARNDAVERISEHLKLVLGLVDPATVGADAPKARAGQGALTSRSTRSSRCASTRA